MLAEHVREGVHLLADPSECFYHTPADAAIGQELKRHAEP